MPSLQSTPSTIKAPQIRRNHLQEILRLKKHPTSIGPLRMANPEKDQHTLNQLCQEIADGRILPSEILLTTGIGQSAKSADIPVRLPSLLVPGLQIMRSFQEAGFSPPQYLVYQATDFIAEMNGIEPTQAQEISQRMQQYLRGFIDEMYPDLKDQVRLEFKLPYEAPTKVVIESLAQEIREALNAVLELAPVNSTLAKSEEQHSQRQGSYLQYAAANVLYNGAIKTRYPFANQTRPKAILPIGGNAEKPFFALTSHFADREKVPVIPLLTHIGSRPTYYPYPDKKDPVSPEELSNTPHPDGPIRHDFEALQTIRFTQDRIKKIFPHS